MRKRVLIGLVMVGVVIGGAVAFVLVGGPPNDYEGVASIEEDASYQDGALLDEAFALPVASEYAEEIAFQSNGSRCGPASVANILRTLDDDDDTEAEVLDGTGYCWTSYCIPGLTLDEVADLARQNVDAEVRVIRDLDLDAFREHLRASNDPSRRYLVNFHRGPLFGRGGGHHSPIAGYLEERDLALVLDVNEEYAPWLVPSARLHEAVNTVDSSTGEERGLLLFRHRADLRGEIE